MKENIQTVNSEVVKIKMNEVISQFSSKTLTGVVKENQLSSLLNAYELVEELKKIINETKS